jgi:hypothetical protein
MKTKPHRSCVLKSPIQQQAMRVANKTFTLGDLVRDTLQIELVPGIVLNLSTRPGITEGRAWLTEEGFEYNDQGEIERIPYETEVSEIMVASSVSEIMRILRTCCPEWHQKLTVTTNGDISQGAVANGGIHDQNSSEIAKTLASVFRALPLKA